MATPAKEDNLLSKNFDHILISSIKEAGPELTLGGTTFKFKPKVPVTAIVRLIKNSNNFDGMRDYITGALVDSGQAQAFDDLLPDIGADGLSEMTEWLTKTSSGFDSDTSPA
jgi:hypothetical protein